MWPAAETNCTVGGCWYVYCLPAVEQLHEHLLATTLCFVCGMLSMYNDIICVQSDHLTPNRGVTLDVIHM